MNQMTCLLQKSQGIYRTTPAAAVAAFVVVVIGHRHFCRRRYI
jgi:hypothetical protein